MRINHIIIRSLRNEATAEDLRELREWRRGSLENERYYQELVRTWALTEGGDDSIPVGPSPRIEQILGEEAAEASPLVLVSSETETGPRRSDRRKTRRLWSTHVSRYAAAAIVAIAFFSAWATYRGGADVEHGANRFVTGASETATVSLKDGTVIRVAPSSRLSIPERSHGGRRVTLEGRAFFAVAHDKEHPFHIRTEAGHVTVVGTRFDLRTHGTSLRVIVLEGTVVLSAGGHEARVSRGQMGRILDGTLLPVTSVPDPIATTDWVGRFLAFQSTPLDEVAREIAHEYGVRVQIEDSALVHRTVTGWFANKSLEDVLRIACAVAAVHCAEHDGVVTIKPLPGGRVPDPGPSRP